eukprot:COSAG01_NODE_16003_length_1279_cov_1.672034_1_plen_61_part_00
MLSVAEVASFDVSELELLIAGVPELDLEDWQRHTLYRSGFSEVSPARTPCSTDPCAPLLN